MNTLTACVLAVPLFAYMGITTLPAWRRRPRANLLTALWLAAYGCGALLSTTLSVALLVGPSRVGHLSTWQAAVVWVVVGFVASDALVRAVNGARALLYHIHG